MIINNLLSLCLLYSFYHLNFVTSNILPKQKNSGIQSLSVKGKFFCGDEPAGNVRVKLVDQDYGPDSDDDMAAGYTNEDGYFELSGSAEELTTIDPHLRVYHDCNDGFTPCQRRWKFELPNHYIWNGKNSPKVMDIGEWNLEARMPDERHDCIH
ncbi:Transthyretin-like family-containing protein [Strongyloides ratti]|uniref:Transthyretin-like family-containing protein n=1 Tax=Strongyloides ratti TaxID=34506 RepID=A0A090KZM3_STRRB|nr:Transthyretin-like family-containing protein [Strongyloides ratti]CEF60659.1 Transthyretin-like family-containing protein [Strongyloides ratti]